MWMTTPTDASRIVLILIVFDVEYMGVGKLLKMSYAISYDRKSLWTVMHNQDQDGQNWKTGQSNLIATCTETSVEYYDKPLTSR